MSDTSRIPGSLTRRSVSEYAEDSTSFTNSMIDRFGEDWIMTYPVLNPVRIMEESKEQPMFAAVRCHEACVLAGAGYQFRLRDYIITAFSIAGDLRGNERQLEQFADYVTDGRSKAGVELRKASDNLLHYVFVFIFAQSGMTTRNRATQYAQGLQPYFDEENSPAEVAQLLSEHGQDRLRRAAMIYAKQKKAAQDWEKLGKEPASASMAEILASMRCQEPKGDAPDLEDEVPGYGSRELPPSLLDEDDLDAVYDDLLNNDYHPEVEGAQHEAALPPEGDHRAGPLGREGAVRNYVADDALKAAIKMAPEMVHRLHAEVQTAQSGRESSALFMRIFEKIIVAQVSIARGSKD